MHPICATRYATPRLVAAIVTIILGFLAARGVRRGTERAARSKRVHANLWWSESERGAQLVVQDRVLTAVHGALRAEQLSVD
jgi:hypothetical protein